MILNRLSFLPRKIKIIWPQVKDKDNLSSLDHVHNIRRSEKPKLSRLFFISLYTIVVAI